MTEAPRLEVQLAKRLDGFGLDVSWSVGNELAVLFGYSGSGKSLTLRMIAGFEAPDFGMIHLAGEDITAVPPNRRGMGMVFQAYALFPNMTAWGNVAFGLRVGRTPSQQTQERVKELLDLVGLADSGHKYPGELSGGQQQRVALARALAIEPRVLLLDEPLSALDAVVRVSLRHEIRRIQSALGITTVYVTHDQEEALSISDRVVVMRRAEIEQIGTPEDVYTQPKTYFVATFVGTINEFPGVLRDARRGMVESDTGSWRLSVPPVTDGSLQDGDPVLVLIRPEVITASALGEAVVDDNRIAAVLEATTLLGPVTRLSLDLHGQRIVADVNTAERGRFARGETVLLSFASDACQVTSGTGTEPPDANA